MKLESTDRKADRLHNMISIVMLLAAVAIGALVWISISHETLYSPFGVLANENTDSKFYFGISIYITIGATLLTSGLIRVALKLSK